VRNEMERPRRPWDGLRILKAMPERRRKRCCREKGEQRLLWTLTEWSKSHRPPLGKEGGGGVA